MFNDRIEYKIGSANLEEIFSHLINVDFNPKLETRVDVKSYAEKLNSKAITFEAWSRNKLVGLLASYFNNNVDYKGYISNVSILPDFTGKGIACNLLKDCIDYATNIKFKSIALEVYYQNKPALSLYQKFDFVENGIVNDYVQVEIKLLSINN